VSRATAGAFYGTRARTRWYAKPVMATNAIISTVLLCSVLIGRVRHTRGRIVFYCHDYCSVLAAKLCTFLPGVRRRSGIIFVNGSVNRRSGFTLLDRTLTTLLNSIDITLCVSRASATALKTDFNIRADAVRAYRIWIDTDQVDAALDIDVLRQRQYEEPIRLLFVGRIVPEKGVKQLLELARYIRQNDLGTRYAITLVGDSNHPLQAEVERAASSGLLTFPGRIGKPELWGWYAHHDVFLMPSIWEEGSGNVALEAYACGVPVIGTDSGGIPENLKEFPFHGILTSTEPPDVLSAVDSLHAKIVAVGSMAVFERSRAVLREKFSVANFSPHEEAIRRILAGSSV
jgi:glycosyltransferase involved in cell wall biosynthesis